MASLRVSQSYTSPFAMKRLQPMKEIKGDKFLQIFPGSGQTQRGCLSCHCSQIGCLGCFLWAKQDILAHTQT